MKSAFQCAGRRFAGGGVSARIARCVLLALLSHYSSIGHAQLVPDGGNRTLANVTNTITGTVTVGTNGTFTSLQLSDNTLLNNSAHGVIGRNAAALFNEVRLTSTTARWRLGANLFLGSNGAVSRLSVSNGGRVENDDGFLGGSSSSDNNVATIAGAGSLWSNRFDLHVGNLGSRNRLTIDNGGRVESRIGHIGYFSTSSNNIAVVSGSGSIWSNRFNLNVGFDGAGNRLLIGDGGLVATSDGFLASSSLSSNNEVTVTGAGSLWNNGLDLYAGYSGGGNRLVITNGGRVENRIGHVGYFSTADNNRALVTGSDSVWSNRFSLNVGFDGSGNLLEVNNGGTLAGSNVFVGFTSLSANNRLVVDGGTVRASSLAGNGTLDVRRGTNVFNSGLMDLDLLLMTNSLGVFEFNGGTLITRGARIASGLNMSLGRSGTTPAVWEVRPGLVDHQVSGVLVVGQVTPLNQMNISSGASLSGNGGAIGTDPGARGNAVRVSSPGSRWQVGGDLFVGYVGPSNQMTVEAGGLVDAAGIRVGESTAASGNSATVTGSGSEWRVTNIIQIGIGGSFNQASVSGGAIVRDQSLHVGVLPSSSNNSVVVTGSGSAWTNQQNVIVGFSGPANQLLIANGGAVLGGAGSTIGSQVSALGNAVIVTGSGSVWSSGALSVGNLSSGNRLQVEAGGWVNCTRGALGFGTGPNNLAVVTGSGSVWSNSTDLQVGGFGANNVMVVSNGGVVYVGGSSAAIGLNNTAHSNSVSVTGAGSSWTVATNLYVGSNGAFNQLIIQGGAAVATGNDGIVGNSANARSNAVVVTGPGSRWLVDSQLKVGSEGGFNQMVISNGGFVSDSIGLIGHNAAADQNSVVVTGSGSVWSNTFVVVGGAGSGNQMIVTNGGKAFSSSVSDIGSDPGGEGNLARITGAGSAWVVGTTLDVGLFGNANRLVVENGGVVTSHSGMVGLDALNNHALVTGVGSLWSNHLNLSVGGNGAANELFVSNEGTIVASNVIVGVLPASTNNRVEVNGGTLRVPNPNSAGVLDVRRGTNVLRAGLVDVNTLLLTNKGTLPVSGVFGKAGTNSISNSSTIRLTNMVSGLAGRVERITVTLSNLTHESADSLNVLLVSPAGQKVMLMSSAGGFNNPISARLVFDDSAETTLPDSSDIDSGTYRPTDYPPISSLPSPAPGGPYSTTLSSFNGTDPNGVWSLFIQNELSFFTGRLVGWSLNIQSDVPFLDSGVFEFNGGSLITRGAFIDNRVPFVVGGPGGVPAQWELSAGSTHSVSREVIVGSGVSTNNLLHVLGGTLNAAALDIRGGINRLDAGLIDVNRLVIASPSGHFELNSGSLRTAQSSVANGRIFTVGNGTDAATLQLLGGTHTFSNNLVVANNGSLIGNGLVDGSLTIASGGRLVPGSPIGRLDCTETVILQGATIMQIEKSGGVLTNDVLTAGGAIFYGGTLTVTDIGTDFLAAGDRFHLFSALPFVGSFTILTLPPLAPGLTWRNSLSQDGSIEVIAAVASTPGFSAIYRTGTNVVFTGTNGTPNASFGLLAATNVALPLSNWVLVLTNHFDAFGRFQITNPVTSADRQRYFRLLTP